MIRILIFSLFIFKTALAADFYNSSLDPMPDFSYGDATSLVRNQDELKKLINDQTDLQTSALLVWKDGKLVVEKYWDIKPTDLVRLHSVTKSILSLLIGDLIDDNRMAVQDRVKKWFRDWSGAKESITIRHLLTQTSGLPPVEKTGLKTTDRVKAMSMLDLVSKPGDEFHYSNGGAYLLGEIVHQETKDGADVLARRRIFGPLDISNWSWDKDATQHVNTSGGLHMTARDLLKIGVLMLNEGQWKTNRLLSSQYIHEATDPGEGRDYGYLWWIRERLYFARGDFGQILAVFPHEKVVVVRLRKMEALSDKEQGNAGWEGQLFKLGSLLKK